ncbi:MAG: FHA domain-containing protein [Acidobacteria bacterium]|nr:FHA domain-containing protein [Acidobacteriota bacterium]
MITCERCQTENIEGSQYCDECGAILRAEPSGQRTPTTGPTDAADTPGNTNFVEPRAARRRDSAEAKATAVRHPTEVRAPAARTSVSGKVSAPELAADVAPALAHSGSQSVPHARLVIHRGRSVGKEFLLSEDESHIGRWDADGGIFPDVDLDSDDAEAKVSRRHARITRRGEQYFIEDLGSTNGTFLNRGRRLLPGDRQQLRDGDEVIVGKTFLRFHVVKK